MSAQDQTLTFEVGTEEGCQCVTLSGSLCDDGIAAARQVLTDTINSKPERICVQVGAVDYVSSSGIGMLVSILKKCHQAKIQFALCGLNADIHELFSLTRLDQVFTITRDLDTWRKSWV